MPIKWIVFNGPPRSGKSSAASWMRQALRGIYQRDYNNHRITITNDSFASPMKHFISAALSEQYNDMNKSKARPELNGYSVREFNSDLAENYMKDRYGEDVFARWLMHRSLKHIPAPDYVVIDDGGFEVERYTLTKVRVIHVFRDGCNFADDSRSYWPDPYGIVHNNSSHEDMYTAVTKIARMVAREDNTMLV